MTKILTLPHSSSTPLSIRAKALVFHDPGSRRLLEHVERLARSDATVLVIGETGTGKELIARHIHHTSERSGPFVAVNCGAFSESLIDAELFGHEAGAFTGATQARTGWFEAANGGTLFLDEIGDLPLALQVKLLRVLQERQVVRLGSRRPIALDVRLVAATNIDLTQAVEAQHFRADLYYRLSVAGVRLPPLRERQADILPLAEHFIGVYCAKLGLSVPVTLSEAARQALQSYNWPGNIRELENVIHYALIVCCGSQIGLNDLKLVPLVNIHAHHAPPHAYTSAAELAEPSTPDAGPQPDADDDVPPTPSHSAAQTLQTVFTELLNQGQPALFDLVEHSLIHAAYANCRQNQVRTAKALGISRNILRTQLRRHGLLTAAEETCSA